MLPYVFIDGKETANAVFCWCVTVDFNEINRLCAPPGFKLPPELSADNKCVTKGPEVVTPPPTPNETLIMTSTLCVCNTALCNTDAKTAAGRVGLNRVTTVAAVPTIVAIILLLI